MRAALGAGRGAHRPRPAASRACCSACIGGVLGLGAGLRRPALSSCRAGPGNLPRLNEIAIDARALAFTLAVSLLSGLLFGLMPALRYAGPRISTVLRGGGRTSSQSRERHRARNVLVVAQVALALVLLVSSGLMIRTFQALRTVEPGFTAARTRLQTVRHLHSGRRSSPTRTRRAPAERHRRRAGRDSGRDVRRLRERHAHGHAHARLGRDPRRGQDATRRTRSRPCGCSSRSRLGFFETSGTRLVAGRDFTWTDLYDHRPVVMVSENLARELWGTPAAAIGKRIRTIDASRPGAR